MGRSGLIGWWTMAGTTRREVNRSRTAARHASLLGLLMLAACNQQPPQTSPSAGAANPTTKPALTVLPSEYTNWTVDKAAAKLADAATAKAAALRLIAIDGTSPACVPATLTDLTLTRFRVEFLGDRYAVGIMDLADDARIHAPLFISKGGLISRPVTDLEEELSILHISKDADLFPHVITTPRRVLLLDNLTVDAIVVKHPSAVLFRLGKRGEFSYISLVYAGDEGQRAEVGRYQWDAFSLMFQGPGCDKLPQPPGGLYELDIKRSHRLNPVGGTFPEAKPIPNRPPPSSPRPGQPPPEIGDDGYDA
jgi:hypothetical protein